MNNIVTIRARRPLASTRRLVLPNLLPEARFVDRDREIGELFDALPSSRCVCCHGPQGAGKSYMLEYVADIINGHRNPSSAQPVRTGFGAALYFDLADSAGWDQAVGQVLGASLGGELRTWPQFVAEVDKAFGRRGVLLILDNLNSPGLGAAAGRAAYSFLATRSRDAVVLGSVDPLLVDNISPTYLDIRAFDREAVSEFVASHGVALTDDDIGVLYDKSGGLPLLLRLLVSDRANPRGLRATEAVDAFMQRIVTQGLDSATRRAVSYVALLALLDRRISPSELERLPIPDSRAHLAVAERRSLLSMGRRNGGDTIRLHDLVRDNALRILETEVADAALVLFQDALRRMRPIEACIFAMFADPDQLEAGEFDALVASVVSDAVETRNYALLDTLHRRSKQNHRLLRFIAGDEHRQDIFLYAHAAELAGLGNYSAAEEELLATSIVRARPGSLDSLSEFQLELYFRLADITHLQNRYDEAVEMFRDLSAHAAAAGDRRREAMALWGVAHSMRHRGRDLDTALYVFDAAHEAADDSGDLVAKISAVTGATGIKVFTNTVSDRDMEQLLCLEGAVLEADHLTGYLPKICKYQAQVAWCLGRRAEAMEIAERAISRALLTNDRALYNLYFERGEYLRLSGGSELGREDYRRVLEFGTGNGDRNLSANATLGLVASDLAAHAWPTYGSRGAARAATLQARELANEADAQATVDAATRLLSALEADVDVQLRLIVF